MEVWLVMANDLTYTQISTVLNDIVAQATNTHGIGNIPANQFTSVGTTLLKMGYDPVMQAISQVLGRTVFVIRPYERKFRGLDVSKQRFGGYTRKLQVSDIDFENEKTYEIENGESVDMYKINSPDPLQTNFYGQVVFNTHITHYTYQLDAAFSGPDELARFWTMINQNAHDVIEQGHESLARAVIGNIIAGRVILNSDSCIHMLTEYNAATGLNLSYSEVMFPSNYPAFVKWAYSRVATISSMFTERTTKYQTNIIGYNTPKHTPYSKQRVYLYAPEQFSISARVLADTFHPNFLRYASNETVNFWQNPDTPDGVDITPVYLNTEGELEVGSETNVRKIFGLIMDEEAASYTIVNEWMSTTPLNSAGGYWNTYFHYTDRYINDFMEKSVVLLLD